MTRIVITGFGPFGSYASNPSSDVIDKLSIEKIPNFDGNLTLEKMSVEYDGVNETVKKLWEEKNPDLIIHIGVHHVRRCIKLEKQSFRDGYCRYDVKNSIPGNNRCGNGDQEILKTTIDCDAVAQKVSERVNLENVLIISSEDPGRYLCGFSYFISLSHDITKSLFIHIPVPEQGCDLNDITKAVQEIVTEIVKTQLKK